MVITVEIYKQIRKMRLDGMSQRQIAATLHISRNTVKKYWDGDSVPWERKDYSREASVLTENVVAFVRRCLDEDAQCKSRKLEHYLPLLEKKGRAIFYARPVQETLPAYFLNWLQKQNLSPKELVEILSRCREKDCNAIMTEASFHAAPVQIEDTVVVQAVDLHAYDAFLCGKAGAAV